VALVIAEINSNEQTLGDLTKTPYQLASNMSDKQLTTRAWEENNARIAQLLSVEDFLFVDKYYEDIERLNKAMQEVLPRQEQIMDLQTHMVRGMQQGMVVKSQPLSHLLN
jgi:hypothetical protein